MMTEAQYQAAMARLSLLVGLDPEPDSQEGCELERIAKACEIYEREHYPFASPTAEQMRRFRDEESRSGPSDLDIDPYLNPSDPTYKGP